jgi:hypothetical protein
MVALMKRRVRQAPDAPCRGGEYQTQQPALVVPEGVGSTTIILMQGFENPDHLVEDDVCVVGVHVVVVPVAILLQKTKGPPRNDRP